MVNSHFHLSESVPASVPLGDSEGVMQHLLQAEGDILRSISAHAPLPQILDDICLALNCQIGNMVSLFCWPGDDPSDAVELARNADLFGLSVFVSVAIQAENGAILGSLEMYSSDARDPSPLELQLIDRAVSLAALAILRDLVAAYPDDWPLPANRTPRANLFRWPTSPA